MIKAKFAIIIIGLISALLAGYLLIHEKTHTYNENIPSDELKEDVEFLFEKIEDIHPNPSLYLDVKDDLLEKIDCPMSQTEFYKVIASVIDPVTVELSDSHTLIGTPKINTKMFPLKVKIFKDEKNYRIFVAEDYEEISKGSEILSINGVDVTELVVVMMYGRKTPPSEAYRLAGLNRGMFTKRLFLQLGYNKVFDLVLKSPDGKTKNVPLPAKKIDIRENHGGMFMEGYYLLDYLADKPYKMWSTMEQKISNQMMNQMKGGQSKKYIEDQIELYWKPIFANDPEGLSSFERIEEMNVGDQFILEAPFTDPKPNPLRFDGAVYVLTSSYTFSGGAILASAFKDFELGILVGEETGDWATSYTSLQGFTLPNSGLWIGCSMWHHIRPNGEDTGRGVIPDYEVKPEPEDIITGADGVLNFVLEELIEGNEK